MPGRIYRIGLALAALGALMGCSPEVTGPNLAPVALAGPDRETEIGQPAILDGKASFDPNGDQISYYWEILAAPRGGVTELSWDHGAEALLVPNLAGVWVVRLRVNDGELFSRPDVVRILVGGWVCVQDDDCNDGNACTDGACQEGECQYLPVEDGFVCATECDGLDWIERTCQAGACTGESVQDCDDQNSCTTDSCQDGCHNEPLPAGSDCGTCLVCDQRGACVDDLDQDHECPPCQRCGGRGTCVNQADGIDLKNECSDGWYCNGLEVCNGQGACRGDYSPCPDLECDEQLDTCTGCTEDGQCPPCRQCTDAVCVDQPMGSDLKEDCPASDCGTGACDGQGACGSMPAGAQCSDLVPEDCQDARCDGVGNCEQGYALEGPSFECRKPAGDCDLAETCDGVSPDCPPDRMWSSVTKCRPAAGKCDLAEYCDGIGPDCPADLLEPVTIECREAVGDCDVADFCDGINPDCPDDVLVPAGTQCRVSTGPCDPAENCDGLNGWCPPDVLAPVSQECRSAAGGCDQAEFCDGLSTTCPADLLVPNGTECRGIAGDCDVTDHCTGVSPDCPADQVLPATVECRAVAGDCDLVDFCDGSNPACPADAVMPATQECRPAAGDCDQAESCDGTGPVCPADAFLPATQECRPAAGDCDQPENCNGFSPDCPSDQLLPATVECRGAGGVCDIAENCDGLNPDCPADQLESAGSLCRQSTDLCDRAEVCDGATVDCPFDELEPAATLCRGSVSDCDLDEYCDGLSVACPIDAQKPDGANCQGIDSNECNSTCLNGFCNEGSGAANLTPCENGTGICCSWLCRTGWNCCEHADCDDSNSCTTDGCSGGSCANTCPDPDCMNLEVVGPVVAGNPAPVNIHMCDSGLDPAWFNCYSSRNVETLVKEDFETGLGSFTTNGFVTMAAEAQSPLPGSIGSAGAKICGHWSYIEDSWIDTSGMTGIGLSFAIDDAALDGDGQMLVVMIGSKGTDVSLVLRGDGMNEPYRSYTFTLPSLVDNDGFYLRFMVLGPGAGFADCAYVDDVVVYDAPLSTQIQTLLTADFIINLGPFSEYDPEGDDVQLQWFDNGVRVRVGDNADAYIVSDPIDTTGVDPANRLVLEWQWRERDHLDQGQYGLAEFSADGGATFQQLSGIGHTYAPSYWINYRAVLPCQAVGIPDLRVRFRAPASASTQDWQGIWLDNVRLREYRPNWIDSFGGFSDAGAGAYTGSLDAQTAGMTSVACSYGCGDSQLWSDWVSVTVNP